MCPHDGYSARRMATKSRHLKTAIQLWVADRRKAGGYTSADLAKWTGVSVDTARGWESRGRPSEDAIAELERRFGESAPRDDAGAVGQEAVLAAIRENTAAVNALVQLLGPLLEDRASDAGRRLGKVELAVDALVQQAMTAKPKRVSRARTKE